ncbi:MAG TPA: ATP-binding cassette domain-containing protein, partial [Ferruginibacter sp.]|nr:ATP-binding cassette domain-containing protein [Ferruginibacter sp.]
MHYASVDQISKSFGIRTLFQRISFHIEEGDKIALVARNGTGKSTLLKILAGKETADEGTVWIHKDARVVYLPQESEFNPELSILDQVFQLDHPVIQAVKQYENFLESGSDDADLMGKILARMDELQAWNLESAVKQVLGKLQLHQPDAKMGQLSGGQRKRVAL